jgi:hypothetical protein
MSKKLLKYLSAATFILLITVQFGCSTNRYRQPITKFQAATAVVTANARTSLTEMNRLEVDRVLNERRLEGKPITGDVIAGAKIITRENLQVRLDALDRLNDYCDLLARIANSDAPESIAKSATELNASIANLTSTVNGLTGTSNDKFKSAFSIAGTVVSEILRAIAQKKIKEALNKAILDGDKPVNNLIEAIGDDLAVVYKVREVGLKQIEQNLTEKYNEELMKTSRDENLLDSLTAKIIANHNQIELLAEVNPQSALDDMQKAYTKVVKHAQAKTPATFADAVDEIEAFAAAAQRLGEAVKELKSL